MDPSTPQIKRLLYISDDTAPFNVDVFNYSNGKHVGTIAGFGLVDGMCVDAKGDVWITNFSNASVVEFAHGGVTPIQTLSAKPDPTGCSINPINGDLAVGNFGRSAGFVQVFKHANGNNQHLYVNTQCWGPAALGYDSKGNLFVEAYNPSYVVVICELRFQGGKLQIDSFDQSIDLPDGAMWDGKYLMLADQRDGDSYLYRVKLPHEGVVKTVGVTTLTDQNCEGTYVLGPFVVGAKNTPVNDVEGTIVVGDDLSCNPTRVNYWAYPPGGEPQKTLHFGPSNPGYQAVSIAP